MNDETQPAQFPNRFSSLAHFHDTGQKHPELENSFVPFSGESLLLWIMQGTYWAGSLTR